MQKLRIINTIVFMEVMNRPRRGGGIFISSLLEPVLLLLVLMVILSAIGEEAAFGGSIFQFLVTGIIPLFVSMRVTMRVMGVDRGRIKRTRLPGAQITDYFIAVTLIEMLIYLVVTVLILLTSVVLGYENIFPVNLMLMLGAWFLLGFLGMGVGLVNLVIIRIIPVWEIIYAPSQRILLFLSGVFFVVDYVHIQVREIVVYNPLSHGITLFRLGYYGNYPHASMNIGYLFLFGFITVFCGLVLERYSRDVAQKNSNLETLLSDSA